MTRRVLAGLLVASTAIGLPAQAPDGNAVLRGAGVVLPRGGAETAFDQWMVAPAPIPPGAFATLLVGMGPVDPTPRVRATYAFGVLAGRSARSVPPPELAGAGVVIIQMLLAPDRRVRVAAARVAGRVSAQPVDGGPVPVRPTGLEAALFAILNQPDETEQLAAMEAIGLIGERAAIGALVERYEFSRRENRRPQAGAALEALTRIGDASTEPIARALVGDRWGERDDATGLVVAYAREKFLKDGSVGRLQVNASHRSLGPQARVYLEELGVKQQ
jgi:hypothetical protein